MTHQKRAEAAARESDRRYREVELELAHASRVSALGQLSASIAHEVSQPLGAVLSYANAASHWLDAQPPNLEEVRRGLGFIVESSVRASEVVDRLRALVKKAPPRKDRLEINEAILQVVALAQNEIASNGILVRTQLVEALPAIQGDRVQLQQVILNLLINAIEAMSAMSEGPRELLFSTAKTDSGGSSRCGIRARDWLLRASTSCSSPSTRPNPAAWDWGYRSAVRSLRRIKDDCGRPRTVHAVPFFHSRCSHTHLARRRIVEHGCSILRLLMFPGVFWGRHYHEALFREPRHR
jgi:hypothetical protein